MKIIVSHPTSNANTKAVVSGLLHNKKLQAFYTSIALFKGQLFYSLGAIAVFKELRRRSFPSSWRSYTKTYYSREAGRLLCSKLKLHWLLVHEKGYYCTDNVYKNHDKWLSKKLIREQKKKLTAVYCYEDGALKTFNEAERLGIKKIYDLPIGYWKAARVLLQEELDKNPKWASTITAFRDSNIKLERKDQELAKADLIFVASSFTKSTLSYYTGKLAKVEVVPYGFPKVEDFKKIHSIEGRKLKVLFVGGLSQRKGISYLFESVKGLEDKVSLTVIGRKSVPDCDALNEALKLHTWIPSLSHREVLKCMRAHDVLVFPSLFEGFGMVITEAMSQGTPVITTDRTAGPDLITDKVNGWIVEASSSLAIRNIYKDIINSSELLIKVSRAAQETAKKRPWHVYGSEVAETIK